MAMALPRAWHVVAFVAICLVGGRIALESVAAMSALRGLLLPCTLLFCAAIWCLRQRNILLRWPRVDDPAITRTGIALGALDKLSKGLKAFHLALYVAVALWFVFALLHPRPLLDPELWVVLPIIGYGLFAVLRAARGFGLALMRGRH